MGTITYYVVLPFARNEDGELCPLEPVEAQSPHGAAVRARALGATTGGAVAFRRTGDPAIGEFEEAVIIATVGEVPTDLTDIAGG